MNDEYEKKRLFSLQSAALDQAQRDVARYQSAKDMFMQRKDLLTSIERQLSLRAMEGRGVSVANCYFKKIIADL